MTQQILTASTPFDNSKANADIILRSSNQVDFYVHKAILMVASDVFESMFAASTPGRDVHPENGLPLVDLTEDSKVLDLLLRLCYPVVGSVSWDLADVRDVLAASVKYEMEAVTDRMKNPLLSFVPKAPVSVYAIACRHHLEDEARIAAAATLELEKISYVPELDHICAGAFHRLLEFRRTGDLPLAFTSYRAPVEVSAEAHSPAVHTSVNVPLAFLHSSADAILRSSDGIDFHVHKFILSLVSPIFADLFIEPTEADQLYKDHVSVSRVSEDGGILLKLLQFCYPLEDPKVESFPEAFALLAAATKYGVARAVLFAKQKWADRIEESPLSAYFIAMERGWDDAAREATLLLAHKRYDPYVSEMEGIPADTYHRLLEFRSRYEEQLYLILSRNHLPVGVRLRRPWNEQRGIRDLDPDVPYGRFYIRIIRSSETAEVLYPGLLDSPVLEACFARCSGKKGTGRVTPATVIAQSQHFVSDLRIAYSALSL